METKLFEKCLFENYKGWVNKATNTKDIDERMTIWLIVIQFETMLNKFFNYDFSHDNKHYMVIKNEKIIYEYNL